MRQIKPKLRHGPCAKATKTQNSALPLVAGLRITYVSLWTCRKAGNFITRLLVVLQAKSSPRGGDMHRTQKWIPLDLVSPIGFVDTSDYSVRKEKNENTLVTANPSLSYSYKDNCAIY